MICQSVVNVRLDIYLSSTLIFFNSRPSAAVQLNPFRNDEQKRTGGLGGGWSSLHMGNEVKADY